MQLSVPYPDDASKHLSITTPSRRCDLGVELTRFISNNPTIDDPRRISCLANAGGDDLHLLNDLGLDRFSRKF